MASNHGHVTILYAIYDSYAPDPDALGLAPRPRLDVTLMAEQGPQPPMSERDVRHVRHVRHVTTYTTCNDVLTSGTTLSESYPVDGE